VLIWEKDTAAGVTVFRDPRAFSQRSVSTLGTHDTDTCVTWWETREDEERAAFAKLPMVSAREPLLRTAQWSPTVHRALLDAILSAGSELCLLLAQDVLSIRDRVNTPGTVGPQNWTWRLPSTIDNLRATPAFAASVARVRDAVRGSGRE
jgi:4-alpha-glucanotransferase